MDEICNLSQCKKHKHHGFYITSNEMFEMYKPLYKIGFTTNVHRRLLDGAYTTNFMRPFTYHKIFWTCDAARLEASVKYRLRDSRNEELVSMNLDEIIQVVRDCATCLNIIFEESKMDPDITLKTHTKSNSKNKMSLLTEWEKLQLEISSHRCRASNLKMFTVNIHDYAG